MYWTRKEIENMERIPRLTLINAVTGIKPANLIGTQDADGQTNLAIFSSVVHLGSNPALLGMVSRPDIKVRRHTLENIQETGFYTINHVHIEQVERAHFTSANFDKGTSEFDACAFAPDYIADFPAPFVKECKLKIGMRHVQSLPIEVNGTLLIIGQIEHLIIDDEAFDPDSDLDDGKINLERIGTAGISGLDTYYSLKKIADFPYARTEDLPDFDANKNKANSE